VLYFAGHGLIREAEEGLWLLSDWNKELRAVAVDGLRHRLYRYGIGQIAIFADACRSLPSDVDAARLDSRWDTESWSAFENRASHRQIYRGKMAPKRISSQGNAPRRPLSVLRRAAGRTLGTKATAFSKLRKNNVTSGSLGEYLRSRGEATRRTLQMRVEPEREPDISGGTTSIS
jgi:hypothetical protein